ncbi:hypothetical protein DFP72DRAFT_402447 [Ephemerocybe angulata]|uniref:Uncharacterized protein n=1 Tax=Ephemerocybe angulata TaxID=980116 RepID=A0A8H6HV26_9AGAR|nr:hypothetical protein DFP72DRAFT_402447 [Tulosesus angulatus]
MALFGKNRFTRIRSNYVASQPTSPVVAPNSQSANGLHSDDESQRRMDAPGETARLRGNRVYAAWPKSECPTPSPWSAYRSASPRSESWMGSFEQHIPAAVKHDRLDISFHPSSRHCTRPKSRVGRAEQRGSEIKERARLRDATLRPRLHWTSHPSKSRRRPNDRVGIRPAVERLPNTTTSPLGTVGTPRSRVGHVCMEDGLFGDERKLAQHQCRRCGSCTAAESPALVMGLKSTNILSLTHRHAIICKQARAAP